jgi:hypothetical protein
MYILHDDFNNRDISQHRKLNNAVKALYRHSRDVEKNNGKNSYIPKSILHNGERVPYHEIYNCEHFLGFI